MDSSSVNTSHNQGTTIVNKEEGKLKMLLSGAYDFIHRETGKMIQKKMFKRAFQLLDKFYSQRKDLELAELIQINRRMIYCINKILKQHLLKPDIEQETNEVFMNLFNRGQLAIFESYKYINLFAQKVMPSDAQGIVLEDVSHLTSSEEDSKEHIKEENITVLIYKNNEYDTNNARRVKPKKELNVYDQEISESSRLAEIVQRSEKPLNLQFELDQFWYNLCELLIKAALIFKKASRPKVAYYYLIEADRIGQSIINTPNPNLVNLCAKIKILLANYYFEIQEYDLSLKIATQAVTILQGEMRIRMNQEKFVTGLKRNKYRKCMKKCVNTTLSALVTMMVNYEATNNFHRVTETLTTAGWLSQKFVPGSDEFKTYVVKLAAEARHRLDGFLKDVADLSFIAEQVFDQELHKIRKRNREINEAGQSNYLKQFNEEMYNLFQIKPLNQQCHFKMPPPHELTQQPLDYKVEQDIVKPIIEQAPQPTEMSLNIFDSDSMSDDSFFDASFFAPSTDNLQFDSNIFERPATATKRIKKHRKLVKPQTQPAPQPKKSLEHRKSVGLIKIGLERPVEYKSKILTSNQYFQAYQQQLTKEEKFLDSGEKYRKKLENMKFRQNPEKYSNEKQDLDVYVNKMVQDKISTGGIRKYEMIQKDLDLLSKKEEFDKKEFGFGRKMLNLKDKEILMHHKEVTRSVPVKIEVDTKVKNHAFIVDGKLIAENNLKELKRKKIDIMVAGKKIIQSQVNINLKDPEETTYLKKVLEKSKKKKLKDLIYKHREALSLTRFFVNQHKEMKELEKLKKMIQLSKEHNQLQQQLQHESKDAIPLVQQSTSSPPIIQQPKEESKKKLVRISENPQDSPQKITLPKQILKKNKESNELQKPSQQVSQQFIAHDDYMANYQLQLQQAEAKRKLHEQIDKQQKKSHNVIGMIIDGVERKIDAEQKELKKLIFTQKGSTKQYVDDDERTYLKFMPSHTDLHRSTYLMYIKKELSEKQTFSFEEVALLRLQMNKKQNFADLAFQIKEANIS